MAYESRKWIVLGTLAGAIGGAVYLATNENARNKIKFTVEDKIEQAQQLTSVVENNKDDVMDQLKESSESITDIFQSASNEVETIINSSKNLKRHVTTIFSSIQASFQEIKNVKNEISENKRMEELPDVEPHHIESITEQ